METLMENFATNYDDFVADLEINKPEVTKSIGSRSSTSFNFFLNKFKNMNNKKNKKSMDDGQIKTIKSAVVLTPAGKNRKSLFGYSARRTNRFCKTCNNQYDEIPDDNNDKKSTSLNETYIKVPELEKPLENATDDLKIRKTQSEKKTLVKKITCKLSKESKKMKSIDKLNKENKLPLNDVTNQKHIRKTKSVDKITQRTPIRNINCNKENIGRTPNRIKPKTPLSLKTIENCENIGEVKTPPIPRPRTKINVVKTPLNNVEIRTNSILTPTPQQRSSISNNNVMVTPKTELTTNENQLTKSGKSKIPIPKRYTNNIESYTNKQVQSSPSSSSIINNTIRPNNNETFCGIPSGKNKNQSDSNVPPKINHLGDDYDGNNYKFHQQNQSTTTLKSFMLISWTEGLAGGDVCVNNNGNWDDTPRKTALNLIDIAIAGLEDIDSKVQTIKEYL